MQNYRQNLYGRVKRVNSIGSFRLIETLYLKDSSLPVHSHDFAYFCFVLQGSFSEKYRKDEHKYNSSSIIFHSIGEEHSDFFHTESKCLNVRLNSRFLDYLDKRDVDFLRVSSRNVKLWRIVSQLYREFYETDEFSPLTVEGLMLELIAEFMRNEARKFSDKSAPKWLLEARDLIKEEFTSDLTIAEIARTVDIHPTHLAKQFRRFFNSTIGDFIRKQRIEFACQKILNSNAPLSEISLESGFYDQSHFIKVFKKTLEITPTEFRAIYKEN